MGCGTTTLKFTVAVMNVLCCIFGAITFSASVYSLLEFQFCEAIKVPCILGSILGGLLFLNTILGCCGTLRQSVRLTWMFTIIMFLLLAGQIAVILFEPVNFNHVATNLIDNVWNVTDVADDYLMTSYEIKYQCCGKSGPEDYEQLHIQVPNSCYYHDSQTNATVMYGDGCIKRLTEMYDLNQRIEVISNWMLVGVEAATTIVAGMLAITLMNVQRRKLYH